MLTDGGHEFKGAFVAGCEQRGIRVTRTKPRHAWTNGFVERVQGTILHEHWRIAFRRHYFTSGRRSSAPSIGICGFTTLNGRIGAIGSTAHAGDQIFWGGRGVSEHADLTCRGRRAQRSGRGCVNTIAELDSLGRSSVRRRDHAPEN